MRKLRQNKNNSVMGWERLFYIRRSVRTCHSDKVTFETDMCGKWESEPQRYLGEEHAGSRKSKCKGPGARVCLVSLRNSNR